MSLPADGRNESSLAGLGALVLAAAHRAGVDPHGLRALRQHSNSVWLLTSSAVVVRLATTADAPARAARAVAITRWLDSAGFPCTRPLDIEQPIHLDEPPAVATFWEYLPQPQSWLPDPTALGRIVRDLHSHTTPPITVPSLAPMDRLRAAIAMDTARPAPVLPTGDRAWLLDRASDLLAGYRHLSTPLGTGLVHSDVHLGNLLSDTRRHRAVLGDWDSATIGPREWDLVVIAADDRFGLPRQDRSAFADAYGYDVTTWPSWTLLRELRELHSLAAHIRRAPNSPPATAELAHRVASLRAADRSIRWHGIN